MAENKNKPNINNASREELNMNIEGLDGPKAEAIVKFRQEHGRIRDMNELREISEIDEDTLNKIKNQAEL